MTTAIANLTGLFKEKYAEKIETLYQTSAILKEDIGFVKASQQSGGDFNQPVVMSPEQGFTYAAPAQAGGPIAMNPSVSMVMQNARVAPFQMAARWVLDYESANRSVAAGAFEPAAMLQMTNVLEQADNRLELSLLYGQEGIGNGTTANVNATSAAITVAVGQWADATFGVSLNAVVNLFNTASGALIGTGADSRFTITNVNTITRVVTVTGTAAGITALGTVAVTIFFNGARSSASVFNEMPGLGRIISNTGSLFNIDAGVYDLWRGNTFSAGNAALTFAKLQAAIALPVGKGLVEDVCVYMNPKTWGDLLTEQAALRKYDSSYSETTTKNGSKALVFFSQNGKMTIKSHPFVKQGDAFIIPVARYRRVGSTDVSFVTPTSNGDKQMWTDLPDVMGYQAKLYSGQTLFTSSPAKSVRITNIVNGS